MSDGLISANQLKNQILGDIGKMTKIGVPITRDYLWGLINHAIEDAPTIDAVPVVRCKNCKWKQGAECVMFAEVRPFPVDFCSRGERREDNGKTV